MSVYLPSVVFALVILVLLLRPAGLFTRGRASVVDRV
jgi:branched-subunit amino acid ABC-type transport system permease component